MTEFINAKANTVAHQFYTGGWTCAHCGGFVGYGQVHSCAAYFSYQPRFTPYEPQFEFSYPDPMLTEIRDLLKQLIALLEDRN